MDLTPEVGAWSAKNFPGNEPDAPALGIYEELGEWNHARLKRAQGIRGTEADHIAAEIDALCDTCVFSMDLMYRISEVADELATVVSIGIDSSMSNVDEWAVAPFPLPSNIWSHQAASDAGTLAHCLSSAYRVDGLSNEKVGELIFSLTSLLLVLNAYAKHVLKVDLATEVRRVWSEVKRRDWQAHPENAHAVAVAEAVTDWQPHENPAS